MESNLEESLPAFIRAQRLYYAQTAAEYDAAHLQADPEHNFSLAILGGLLDFLGIDSVLDAGCGTGRALAYLKRVKPSLHAVGIEPVAELRAQARAKGFGAEEVRDGDLTALHFDDDSFDLVCAFAVLHHVRDHERAVAEMLRVARRAVFISDVNIYGQGGRFLRLGKWLLRGCGLWPLAFRLKTRGQDRIVSAADGVSFSYSVFDSVALLRRHCRSVHPFATRNAGGGNLLRGASHAALLAIKNGPPLP